jgi:hypothetical protein
MNPNQCRVALRRRGPLEVFDLTTRLLRAGARDVVALASLTVLPLWALLGPWAWWVEGDPLILLPALVVAAVPLTAPFTVLSGRLLFAPRFPARAVLLDLLHHVPQLAWAWLVQGAIVLVGVATCGFGWLAGHAVWHFVEETSLLERVGPGRSLGRSQRLASLHPGAALAGTLGRVALTAWCALVAEGLGQALLGTVLQLGSPFGSAFDGRVTPWVVLGVLAAQPVFAMYRLLLYVDVRTRVEGWDLQVRLRAAGMAS